jgi:hypothetical protein
MFEKEREWMLTVGKGEIDIELELKPFPTYDQMRDRFWKNSDGVVTQRLGRYEYTN